MPNHHFTFFTTCKPFKGEAGILQRNALRSWHAAGIPVILCGPEEGVADIAAEIGALHIPDIDCNAKGTPLIRSIFSAAEKHSTTQFLAYLNADIIVTPDMLQAMYKVVKAYSINSLPLLMTSRRRNIPLGELLNMERSDWLDKLSSIDQEYGVWDQSNAIDLFLFNRGLFNEIIPLVVGHMQWDNWLLWKAQQQGADVIDVSLDAALLHPIHGYKSDGTGLQLRTQGEEAAKNRKLAAGNSTDLNRATTHVLQGGQLFAHTDETRALISKTCETDHKKELKAGLKYLSSSLNTRTIDDIVDCCRTLMWRNERYFPFLETASAETLVTHQAIIAASQHCKNNDLLLAADILQDIVCATITQRARHAVETGKQLFIWGTGQAGMRMLALLERHHIKISGFLDSNEQKTGHMVGKYVTQNSRLFFEETEEPVFVLIASMYLQEIAVELENNGLTRYQDYSG